MRHPSPTQIAYLKLALFIACLIPGTRLLAAAALAAFGPDPVAEITHTTGIWSLNLLMTTLAVTPLRRILGWNWLMRLRRTLALYAFFYACLHVLAYLIFDQFFDWREILKDMAFRPYIAAGCLAFALMIPLALTSTNTMMKRMGGRNWKLLHRLTYGIAIAAVFHYLWLVKRDITLPAYYILALLGLFWARWTGTSLNPASYPADPGPGPGLASRAAARTKTGARI